MKKSVISIVLMFVLSFGIVSAAQAAGKDDVEKVVRLVNSAKSGIIIRKTYEARGTQIVFVYGKKRYTLYNNENLLSVWVRPNGTAGREDLLTFSDDNLDGAVDFGIGGDKLYDERRFPEPVGLEHRAYFQALYNEAIAAALKRIK